MNTDLFLTALGTAMPGGSHALPVVQLGGRPVTITTTWSEQAVETAFRRGSALLVAGPTLGSTAVAAPGLPNRPWPIVVATDSPWTAGAADLALLVGSDPASGDAALDEASAASRTKRFFDLAYDGPLRSAASDTSLIETVPFALDGPYDIRAVLSALVDDVGLLELDEGYADEVYTAVARIAGRSTGILASRAVLSGGRLSPAGCARAERMVNWCVRANRPLLCLVDSNGVSAPTNVDDLDMVTRAAICMRSAPITKVVVVMGRAVGLAATVLGAVGARADFVLPWPRASYALAEPSSDADPNGLVAACSVELAARNGDVLDVVHPDDTRERVIEMFDLCRGQREYSR